MAVKKTQSQMWKEFGAWLRAEDVAKWVGKATGAKEAVAKTTAAREKSLRDRFDPSARPTRVNPGAKPTTSVGGGRGTNPGNTGFTTKPPVRTTTKPVYDSIRRTPVTSPKPGMIGNSGRGSMIGNRGKGSISNSGKGSISNSGTGSMIGNKGKGSISKTGTGSMIGSKGRGSMIGKKKK